MRAAGVPVFVADVKGDLSGLSQPGDPNGKAAAALKTADVLVSFLDHGPRIAEWRG